jgi:hypothetical protein
MRICPFRPIGLSRREPVVERCPARQLVEYPLTLVGDRFWKSKQRRLAPRSARGLIAARPGRPRLRADDFAFFDQFAKVIADLGNSPAEQLGDPARGRPPPVVPLRPGRQRRIAFDHRRGESLTDSAAKCGRPNEHRPILPGSLDGDLGTSIPVTNNCDVEELGGRGLRLGRLQRLAVPAAAVRDRWLRPLRGQRELACDRLRLLPGATTRPPLYREGLISESPHPVPPETALTIRHCGIVHGAFMEPSGRNRWQPLAKGRAPKTAQIGRFATGGNPRQRIRSAW